MQRSFAALSLAAAALWTSAASAESIAVLSVEMAGDAEPELRPRVAESLAEGLAEADRRVVSLDTVMDELADAPELLGCTSTACLDRIAERVGAREFVRAELRTDGVTYTLSLRHLATQSDEAMVGELAGDCTVCTRTELFEWVGASAEELLRPERTASAAVLIRSDPPGARVAVGGREIGATPAEAKLPVGDHEITAELEGYTGATEAIRVEEGKPGPRSVELDLLPEGASGSSREFGPWRWVAAGGAVASAAAGVGFLAADGAQTCELEAPQTQCETVFDGRRPGAISLGVGAVLGGLSGWMFYRDARRDSRADVSAGPGAGGSVTLRF